MSCRNLLIYFDDRLQQSVLPLLHYALRPGGYLFLGPSESVGRFDHLFPAIDGHAGCSSGRQVRLPTPSTCPAA